MTIGIDVRKVDQKRWKIANSFAELARDIIAARVDMTNKYNELVRFLAIGEMSRLDGQAAEQLQRLKGLIVGRCLDFQKLIWLMFEIEQISNEERHQLVEFFYDRLDTTVGLMYQHYPLSPDSLYELDRSAGIAFDTVMAIFYHGDDLEETNRIIGVEKVMEARIDAANKMWKLSQPQMMKTYLKLAGFDLTKYPKATAETLKQICVKTYLYRQDVRETMTQEERAEMVKTGRNLRIAHGANRNMLSNNVIDYIPVIETARIDILEAVGLSVD